MMALIRFIYDFLRKDEWKDFGYIRRHRRRNLLIALDALITVSIVFGGVAYASQSSKNVTLQELMRVGAMPMKASEFVAHVQAEGGREYWLGEMQGYGITSDARTKDVRYVSYVRNGSDFSDLRAREITIISYRSSIDTEGIHQFSAGLKLSTSVTATGLIVQYDKKSMMDEVISMSGNLSKVSIHYLEAQSLQTLLDNAMALRVAK